MYTSIYSGDAPELLKKLAETQEMQRLADVGMHCGCEYTDSELYKQARFAYTRLTHSIGVANIVWRFTRDVVQAAAGLLHDIATPVFAHTIDFMNNDHVAQESTEDKTRAFIDNSESITALLKEHGISIDEVSDYHKYPIADNDTPMLSADRLEYTLGNGHIIYHVSQRRTEEIYNNLLVAENELGAAELCFQSVDVAKEFAEITLRNSHFYVRNEDRFSMQYLADIVRRALETGALERDDLYSTESAVIKKLTSSGELSAAWETYRRVAVVAASQEILQDRYCVKVDAKRRYIDPLVLTAEGVRRVTAISADVKAKIDSFLCLDFGQWLYAV